jgi:hypothetical protein
MTNKPAFAAKKLACLMYADGFTAWRFKASVPLSCVLDAGYFDQEADLLAFGDEIHVTAKDALAVLGVVAIEQDRVMVAQMSSAHLPVRRPRSAAEAAE